MAGGEGDSFLRPLELRMGALPGESCNMAYTFNIFAESDFGLVSRELLERLKARIQQENKNYMLNVNRTEYLNHIASEFEIAPLGLDFDNMTVSSSERMIPAEEFPWDFHVLAGKSYPKQVVKYHIPFTGDARLLRYIPNPRLVNSRPVSVEGKEVCFELRDFYGDPNRIKQDAAYSLNLIRQQAATLEGNIAQYNRQIRPVAESSFDARKEEILKQEQVLAALGVPVRRSENVPRTFAVPAATRRQIVPKPQASSEKYVSEPTVDQSIYQEILQTILDTGRVFERLPSTYAGKDEETLRDHLILNLEPRFQIGTTGETFNKSGKTDILMRYQGKNVFVAECKFWGGQKRHHETIDQLLSYLTWRDSKAAIVYFVDTKEMSAPIKAIEETTRLHECFVADEGKREESWFRYEFHLPGDQSRGVHISILCFHLPRET